MSGLAFCCGRRCSDHGAAVQAADDVEKDTLFVYTDKGNQEASISLHLWGKLCSFSTAVFYICFLVEHDLHFFHWNPIAAYSLYRLLIFKG